MGLWSSLTNSAPELARPIEQAQPREWDEYPGFKIWLVQSFALGNSPRRIGQQLEVLRREQIEAEEQPWPFVATRQLKNWKRVLRPEWEPLEEDLAARIENVGVIEKNRRLVAYARTVEELEDRMWTEPDKSGRLYLVTEFRQLLKQIAEEKGELGERDTLAENVLLDLATIIGGALDTRVPKEITDAEPNQGPRSGEDRGQGQHAQRPRAVQGQVIATAPVGGEESYF